MQPTRSHPPLHPLVDQVQKKTISSLFFKKKYNFSRQRVRELAATPNNAEEVRE